MITISWKELIERSVDSQRLLFLLLLPLSSFLSFSSSLHQVFFVAWTQGFADQDFLVIVVKPEAQGCETLIKSQEETHHTFTTATTRVKRVTWVPGDTSSELL